MNRKKENQIFFSFSYANRCREPKPQMDEMDEPFFMTIYYLCMSRNFSAWRQTLLAMSLFDEMKHISLPPRKKSKPWT